MTKAIQCPHCGKTLKNSILSTIQLNEAQQIPCPHCGLILTFYLFVETKITMGEKRFKTLEDFK